MPENEFEKKIASEMQELNFTPSATVWPQVEARIRKKRDRRILLFIFLLAGLGLLGWWQWDNLFGKKENEIVKRETSNGDRKADNSEKVKQEINTSNDTGLNKSETSTTKLKEDDENKQVTLPAEKILQLSAQEKPVAENNIAVKQKPPAGFKTRPAKNEKEIKAAQSEETSLLEINSMEAGAKKDSSSKTNEVVVAQKAEEPKLQDVKQADQLPVQKTDSTEALIGSVVKNADTVKDSVLTVPLSQDTVIAELAKKKSTDKKWKWGAQFTPGISFLNENGFSIGGLKSASADFQSPSGAGGSAAPQRQLPSDVKPGFGFQLGGFLQKEISRRSNISLGLQYAFYSHRLGIGTRRDSLLSIANQFAVLQDANAVFNAGQDTMNYINRYHFIELPLRFQWQINKNSSRPMYWGFGFTVGHLIASNAIQYDTAFNGIYYQNKKHFNKTQFSLSTGFSFTLANNRRMQWTMGPYVQFHLNKLADNPFENKKYLFFTGLRSTIIFKRK